ncbi:MAG: hypothetical protein AAF449_05205 [Myxococcota bacterium]
MNTTIAGAGMILVEDGELQRAIDDVIDASEGPMTRLVARNVQSLSGIEALVDLRELHLTCCALSDLDPLKNLDLEQLVIERSVVDDYSALSSTPIESLDLSFTTLQELDPLLAMPQLRSVALNGCPLSEAARHEPLAVLTRGIEGAVRALPSATWEIGNMLWAMGAPLCFGFIHGRWVVAWPGMEPANAGDRLVVNARPKAVLEAMHAHPGDPEAIFAQLKASAPAVTSLLDGAPLEDGDGDWASSLVQAAPIDDDLRSAVLRFIDGFPDRWWFRRTPERLGQIAQEGLPDWLHTLEQAWAGLESGLLVWMGLPMPGPQARRRWYRLGLAKSRLQTERARWSQAGLVPIGVPMDAADPLLCLPVEGEVDGPVIRVDDEQVGEPIFEDYAALLDAVDALMFEDGRQIERR